MEETLVTSFLERLNYLLIHESEIVYGLEDQILLLKTKLSDLKSQIQLFTDKLIEIGYFLTEDEDGTTTNTNISSELKKSIQNWLGRFRDTIYDADDCTDQFIIRMNSEGGLDREVAGVVFQSELRMINECLVEVLDGKSQLDKSIASIEHRGEVNIQSSSFALKFNSLPFYLKSCLMYCRFFPENNSIWKERLIQLLMAEGLIQEIPGERMEDIAEENIIKLIELGMLKEKYKETIACAVPIPYLNFVAGDETIFITNTNSEAGIPLNIRRLLIHDFSGNTIELNLNHSLIRSIIISERVRSICHLNFLETMFHRLKLLRVLDLKFVGLKSLPEEVGNLIHLRYLGLTYCRHLKELPDSLCSLGNLQTLDITDSGIKVLPSRIMNLQQLRHLLMETLFHSVLIPTGLGRLTNLQTLSGLYAGSSIASELSNLTQLRKLDVIYLSELEDEIEFYASIMKMTGLLSLSLSAEDRSCQLGYSFNERLLPSFEHFSPPPCLRNLRLVGCLQEIPDWLSSMENLTELHLTNSDLPETPTSILQFLPNLKDLSLDDAFTAKHMGREFFRSGGFPSLEVLSIGSRSLIEWIEVEEGALPSLKCLRFYNCPRLRTLPEGLQLITTLKELHVIRLHGDLARKLSPNGGRENYKIEHIPSINLYD